jgi:hypothetical protein
MPSIHVKYKNTTTNYGSAALVSCGIIIFSIEWWYFNSTCMLARLVEFGHLLRIGSDQDRLAGGKDLNVWFLLVGSFF